MSISTSQLTPDFIQGLMQWQDQGNRSVKIEIGRRFWNGDTEVQVWVWDTAAFDGKFIDCVEQLPTTAHLLQEKLERLKKEQKRLEEGVF